MTAPFDAPPGRNGRTPEANAGPDAHPAAATAAQKPTIETARRETNAIAFDAVNAILASNTPPTLFVHGNELAELVLDEKGIKIQPVTAERLTTIADEAAHWVKSTSHARRQQQDACRIPPEVAQFIFAHPRLRQVLPPLKAVALTPFLRADGTVCQTPGYDPASRIYYEPNGLVVPPVPTQPTLAERTEAVALIDDVIADFRFDDPLPDRAHTFANFLTPLVRSLVDIVPLWVVDAPQPRSGKSLLASVGSWIHYGFAPGMKSCPPREEEWEKKLLTILRDGEPYIIFDNAKGRIDSSALEAVLTAQAYSGRILGFTASGTYDNLATWVLTSNNARFSEDMASGRMYRTRIDAKTERPEQRDDIRHDPLKPYVLERRPQLLWALLTIARSWYAAGRPAPRERVRLGMFSEWVDLLSGILSHAGIDGFLSNLEKARDEADDDRGAWIAFLDYAHTQFPESFTAKDLYQRISAQEQQELLPYSANMMDKRNENLAAVQLGKELKAVRGHVYGGFRVVDTGKRPQNKVLWRVEALAPAPEAPPCDHYWHERWDDGTTICKRCGITQERTQEAAQ